MRDRERERVLSLLSVRHTFDPFITVGWELFASFFLIIANFEVFLSLRNISLKHILSDGPDAQILGSNAIYQHAFWIVMTRNDKIAIYMYKLCI